MPVLFGVDVPSAIVGRADPIATAGAAEALGFDFVSVNDHVMGEAARFESWTLLSWIAASTSRIRLASRVLGVPYRFPALVAKMAESFDRLSDGRFILGLGAGSGEAEFSAMGIPASSLRERVDGLEDAIEIIHGLWEADYFTYNGRQHQVRNALLRPRPQHRIPIWLGAVGPRGLELTGRLADGWIPSLEYAPPERAGSMIQRITSAAERAGRDPSTIQRIYNVGVGFEPDHDESVIVGSPDAIVERLGAFLDLGFTGFNFIVPSADREITVERLAEEVVPALRQLS
jgi:alkanesulfonate monooxygenase SsuD/methylene tetrahydromethanopterin reductase-like flavin-dependent oxidoreductase (luciferase family)